ncbi:DUF2931 family protein [Chryseobacterium sp. SNU WT5]|uniref:DUF2931 family protein n=1 Tax=Chryseobacterium sp. SNU WT5 TaxID=2594269 RepID=UPI001E2B615A|nr:DUF2931 family protein [Chryseobacterium sp. SNU WT5]
MEEKFKWAGGISAPKEYQMQVYFGQIIADDFQYGYSDIVGTIQGGWGNVNEAMGSSDVLHEIPHTLEFTWFSVVENKYYAGHWDLDTVKITKLFKEGFTTTKFDYSLNKMAPIKGTYDLISVGMAPGGKLVLWLSGAGNQVEVGFFQAKEIEITKEEAYEDFQYTYKPNYRSIALNSQSNGGFVDDLVHKKIQEEGYPDPKIYEDFRERFNWRLKIILANGNIIENRRLEMCNGEKETIYHNENNIVAYNKRAIPYNFDFDWKDENGKKYHSEIAFTGNTEYIRQANKMYNGTFLPLDFNKTEIYKLFREKLDKNASIDIVVDVSSNKDAVVYVEQNGTKFPLKEMDKYAEPY